MRQGGKSGKGGLLTSGEWVDLAQAGVRQAVQADFCVVGGGAAGIYSTGQTTLVRRPVDSLVWAARPRVGAGNSYRIRTTMFARIKDQRPFGRVS